MNTDKNGREQFTFGMVPALYAKAWQSVFIRVHPWLNCLLQVQESKSIARSQPHERHAQGGRASRHESSFKIRQHAAELRRGFYFAKTRILSKDGIHLREVIGVIGAKANGSGGLENLSRHLREARIDQTIVAVLPFRPRIRKINV